MKSELEKFLILFSKLQRETNNSPDNLNWLVTEKPNLSELCWDLNYQYMEISRLLLKKRTKHTISPNPFFRKWDEYKNRWESRVAEAAEGFSNEIRKEFLRQFDEALSSEGEPPEQFYQDREKTPKEWYRHKHKY